MCLCPLRVVSSSTRPARPFFAKKTSSADKIHPWHQKPGLALLPVPRQLSPSSATPKGMLLLSRIQITVRSLVKQVNAGFDLFHNEKNTTRHDNDAQTLRAGEQELSPAFCRAPNIPKQARLKSRTLLTQQRTHLDILCLTISARPSYLICFEVIGRAAANELLQEMRLRTCQSEVADV